MKYRELLKLFKRKGWELLRHGHDHDIVQKGKLQESIPRHREVDERLARALIRKHGLK